MIDTISFDLDDTLWDNKPVIIAAEQQLRNWVVERTPKMAPHYNLKTLLEYRSIILKEQPSLRHRISELRQATLRYALQQHGYDRQHSESLAAEGFALFLQARHNIEPYTQAEPLLAAMSKRYTLIALTNGNADINRMTLGRYFTHSYRAEQIGRAKPDPGFYQDALKRASIDASRTLHIGDDYKNDVLAARDAGLLTLWFNPSRQPEEDGSADIEVQELSDIPDAVEHFCNR